MLRPVLGYGYGAFWERTGSASVIVRAVVGWDTPHSHNGFLDLWLDIGLVGLLIFLTAYVLAMRRAWMALRVSARVDGLWAMAFLIMLLLGNLMESPIKQNALIWVIFVAVAGMPSRLPTSTAPLRDGRERFQGDSLNDRDVI